MIQAGNETLLYKDPAASIEDRIRDLLQRMTFQEKVRQLDQYFGASFMSAAHPHMHTVMADDAEIRWDKIKETIGTEGIGCIHDLYGTVEVNNAIQRYSIEQTRLGIPILFSEEALHGLLRPGCTVYPHAITMASTWNPELVGQVGKGIAAETRSLGIHETFGPVLDLAREPRWGRVEETYGEDTHLASRMAVAMIRGLQGDNLASSSSIIAEPKHFAVHGIPEAGLNHSPASIGMNDMRSYHLPVFEAAFVEAGAINAMCSYNSIDGVPCAADYSLLTEVLRDEWHMPGFVRSDLGAISRLEHAHFTASSGKEAIRQALQAGTDMQYYDYPHDVYQGAIIELIESGELDIEVVDTAVSRVLNVKFMLGLFETPYVDPHLSREVIRHNRHRQTALQVAREGICLLQNKGQLLPLGQTTPVIAVIGPSADHARLGDYTPYIQGFVPTTIRQGIEKLVSPKTKVLYAKGTGILADELEPIPLECLTDGGGNPGLLAEYFNNPNLEGEPVLTRHDASIDFNWVITKPGENVHTSGFSVRWTGKLIPRQTLDGYIGTVSQDSMRLWLDGQLIIDGWGQGKSARKSVPVTFEAGKAYDVRVEYCKDTNGVEIMLGWSHTAEGIQQAVAIASQADVAIVALGDNEKTCGEGVDRDSLDLPGNQLQLLKAIYDTGTPVVLVLQNGRPVTLDWESKHIPAIIEAWYPGELGGQAIAEVLFGDYNPAGRLPISFPRTIGQIPVYYNRRRGGSKHYAGGDNRPLYAFGHGLSYTTFQYDNLLIHADRMIRPGDDVSVTVDITNCGQRDGDEVIQLYIADVFSSVARPEKELKHFKRIHLKAGEKKTVSFTITPKDLSTLGKDLRWTVEPGTFQALVGPSSDRIALQADFIVV
ncbi:glycoside hydrolase family 3 N-terminal domain-containing protein [Paenibacillus sp. GCM10012307]|uniref:Glycoside hydrolase family 3 C-terminal domain-containing protein n=1 Tax=Paenibacillus roseus TaxID=2798579 RepID=A0A934J8H9_9BACL|nr:glycoside hydrolase family 3 N-terminal domain-containing protein [Paenibacillus roseus]MBJ6362233.1 glycoside hydrolase family 3 C-terminal domain-containing protein [Paenibacillus roseus]